MFVGKVCKERTPNAWCEAINNGLVANPELKTVLSFNRRERLYSIELDKPRLWTSKVEAENAKAKEVEEQRMSMRVSEWQRPITYFFESIGTVNPQSQREAWARPGRAVNSRSSSLSESVTVSMRSSLKLLAYEALSY